MFLKIESIQNKTIKNLVQLREKSRERKKQEQFLVEGVLEIKLALASGYKFNCIYVCFDIIDQNDFENNFLLPTKDFDIIEVSVQVYEKIAYRASTEGVVGVAQFKDLSVNFLELKSDNPLILVAEAPEKPGNIGALLRTADAANVDAVIIANPKTDLYNPNVIRSSVGGVFTNTIAVGSTKEIISFLQQHNINIYGAILQLSLIHI